MLNYINFTWRRKGKRDTTFDERTYADGPSPKICPPSHFAVSCNMKCLIFTCFACLLTNTVNAQTKWFIKAGATQSTASVFYKQQNQSVTAKNGFTGAIGASMQFEGALYFVPTIGFSKKGFAFSPSASEKLDYSISYIDVAPGLQFNVKMGSSSFLVLGFAPLVNFSTSGTLKKTIGTATTQEKLTFGFGSYGRVDLGIQASLGLKFNKFFIEAGYTNNSANINQDEENRNGDIYKNKMFSVQLGYYLR